MNTVVPAQSSAVRWFRALKPNSWSKLLVPCLLGQAIGALHATGFSVPAFLLGLSFTLLGLAHIVLVNDWRDQQVDRIKRQMFPDGCSPKTIPDGFLRERSVLLAGVASGAGALLVAALGALWLGQPKLFPLAVIGVLLFVAYSLPPIQLNYRGGGELLEAAGVGIALPAINAFTQSPALLGLKPWLVWCWRPEFLVVVAGFGCFALASAVASGLSDEESDRLGGKRTLTTHYGNPAARAVVSVSATVGAAIWLLGGVLLAFGPTVDVLGLTGRPTGLAVGVIAGGVVALAHTPLLLRSSPAATTNAFRAQAIFKGWLHRALARSAILLCLVAFIASFLTES